MESPSSSKKNKKKTYNFLINASNQANLVGTSNTSPVQLNSIFVIVSPYYVEKFNYEGLDIDIRMDDSGSILINGYELECFEVKPGVSVFGISNR